VWQRTVDVAWEVTKDSQEDVDEEICSTASDEEDAYGREKDGYDDEKDCGDHVGVCFREILSALFAFRILVALSIVFRVCSGGCLSNCCKRR
jgi:hypothetical protein